MTQVRRITLALFAIMPIAFTSLPAKAQDIVDTAVAAGNFPRWSQRYRPPAWLMC